MATSEVSDESSRKRHRLFLENTDELSSEIEDSQTTTTTAITAVTDTSSQISIVTHLSSSKNVPRNRQQSHSFSEGKPAQLEAHLSNECISCPEDISRYWREKVAERDPNYPRKSKKNCTLPNSLPQTTMTSHYASNRIPFDIIDNLFIRDMLTELNPAYSPPSRTTLSNRLFDEELAQVNKAVDNDLEKADHLILG
ncbi:hypothetical protein C2G38_2167920 [Gigaspora rosea]|uniref:Uncharacterized protein n=1 Tax=Gigaspora rosea TaxID=44941 RepID=A0A397VQB1_9GLOM|nr:hypothetical protein C2G38_2167920 [Gigaspora rosea]